MIFANRNAVALRQQPRMPDPPPRRNLEPIMEDEQNEAAHDPDNVEAGIEDLLRNTRLRAEPEPQSNVDYARAPLPPYVEHAEGTDQAVKLTAQAVVAQYEAAAKTVLDMKAPVQEWVEGHQLAIDDLGAAMKYIDETAQRLRDLGKRTFEQYQQSALAMAKVRKNCDDICSNIEKPS